MKKFLTLATLAFCASGFGKECNSTPSPCPCPTIKNPICLYELYDNQGCNLGLRADALYMNYTSPVLVFASEEFTVLPVRHSHLLGVPGKMSVGCDVALSYTMPNQPGYSFEASWYHIVAKFSRRDTASDVLLSHSVSLTTAAPGTVAVRANMTINFFDLLIQKKFGFGDWVSVMPAVGLLGGYMNSVNRAQTQASTATSFGNSTTTAELDQFIKFEGIGLKLGGKSSFKIGAGFKLMAELFYSVMYGFSKTRLLYSSNGNFVFDGVPTGLSGANLYYDQHHGRALFDSLLGLMWEWRSCNESMFFDIHAGLKFQSFSDGWMEFEAEFNNDVSNLPLYGQGLQAGATFKF